MKINANCLHVLLHIKIEIYKDTILEYVTQAIVSPYTDENEYQKNVSRKLHA